MSLWYKIKFKIGYFCFASCKNDIGEHDYYFIGWKIPNFEMSSDNILITFFK